MKFLNKSPYEFIDISSELYRVYVFSNISIKIDKPIKLAISKSGHRIFDSKGISHYIPNEWVHIYWEVKKGMPNFVK